MIESKLRVIKEIFSHNEKRIIIDKKKRSRVK